MVPYATTGNVGTLIIVNLVFEYPKTVKGVCRITEKWNLNIITQMRIYHTCIGTPDLRSPYKIENHIWTGK